MAYSNSIALAKSYLPILDEVYKAEAKTAVLEAGADRVRFKGANKIELFKTSMNGLGNYGRNTGYVQGAVTGTWEEKELEIDRGRSFMVDVMDNEESLGMAFGTLSGEFLRTQVVPEMDAYRFAKIAGTSGISSANADITVGTTDVPGLIQAAEEVMADNEVPTEGNILFVSEKCYNGLRSKIDRRVMNLDKNIQTYVDYYDDMQIIRVPKGRFNTAITLNDGTTAGQTDGGYVVPASTSYPINFMIVHKGAIACVTKHVVPKIFSPDVVQDYDGWKFNYRVYHDLFVLDNKKAGVYMHRAATANT